MLPSLFGNRLVSKLIDLFERKKTFKLSESKIHTFLPFNLERFRDLDQSDQDLFKENLKGKKNLLFTCVPNNIRNNICKDY